MGKLGKEIENRLDVSRKVVAAARVHGPEVAPRLAERALAAQGASKAPKNSAFLAMFVMLADSLEASAGAVRSTALAYTAEMADDTAPRTARDNANEALLTFVVKLRSTVEDIFGSDGLATYALENESPRTPVPLSNHVESVLTQLAEHPAEITTELGTTFSTKACASALKKKKAALDAALKTVDREERELEGALGKRNAAIEEWVEVYQGVANTLTGLFRLGGRWDLAERVRPTSRTISGEDAGPPDEGETTDKSGPGGGAGGAAP